MATAKAKSALDRIESPDSVSYAILILSPDAIRAGRAEASALEKLLPQPASAESLVASDGSELSARQLDDVLNELGTLSLFSKRKVWRLRHADKLDAALAKRVAAALPDLAPGVHAVISAEKLAAAHPISKKLAKGDWIVDLGELKGADLRRWVQKEFTLHGHSKTAEDLAALMCLIGEDNPDRIAACVEQLALYCGDAPPTVADAHRLFEVPQVANEFELIDALARADRGKLELLCSRLLGAGKSPFPLLALIHRAFAQYASIQAQLKKTSNPDELSRLTNVPAWLVRKQLPSVRMFSAEKISAILRAIMVADSKLKNRSLGPEAIMSDLFSVIKA